MLKRCVSISVVQQPLVEAEISGQYGRSPIAGSERSKHLSQAFEKTAATREEI